jgi:beta-lactam-binding protein with PASTA domain
MLIEYLSFYLIFVVIFSILVSLIVLKLNFPAPRVVIPVIIAIILLPAVVGYLYVTYFTSIPEVVVPDLTGKFLEKALGELASLDLKGRHAGSLFDMKYPEGSVVSQRPEAGRMVKVGRVVTILTSSGKRKVIVPNLLGRPAVQAEAVLSAKGLFLGEVNKEFAEELEPGIILTQSPLPGEDVEVASLVNIAVSSSEEVETVVEVTEEAEEVPQKDSEQGGFWPWR